MLYSAKENTKKDPENEVKRSGIGIWTWAKMEKIHVSHCLLYKNQWQKNFEIKIHTYEGVKRGEFFDWYW